METFIDEAIADHMLYGHPEAQHALFVRLRRDDPVHFVAHRACGAGGRAALDGDLFPGRAEAAAYPIPGAGLGQDNIVDSAAGGGGSALELLCSIKRRVARAERSERYHIPLDTQKSR
jgi:hypothetical protein